MMASSSSKPKKLQRPISPSGRFCSSTISSSMSSLSSHARSSSPNRISIHRSYISASPSVRFSIDNRKESPATSSSKTESNQSSNYINHSSNGKKKKMCMCAPTTHPGSFRCRLHKNVNNSNQSNQSSNTLSYHRLYARRSAMTNSLVRIGTVEGDLMKRALAALIRPSSHQLKRRDDFQPKPSRLSVMSKAED